MCHENKRRLANKRKKKKLTSVKLCVKTYNTAYWIKKKSLLRICFFLSSWPAGSSGVLFLFFYSCSENYCQSWMESWPDLDLLRNRYGSKNPIGGPANMYVKHLNRQTDRRIPKAHVFLPPCIRRISFRTYRDRALIPAGEPFFDSSINFDSRSIRKPRRCDGWTALWTGTCIAYMYIRYALAREIFERKQFNS